MAKNKVRLKIALLQSESERQREVRISETHNGLTLRTRVVGDRKKYNRNIKHRKSPEAEGFYFFSKNALAAGLGNLPY